MEFLLHPVTMTLVMSAILVTLQVLGQAALAKLTPEQATRWPALALPALLVVMTSIVVVPTINHLWAERRDVQNEERVHHRDLDAQRREVRDAHLDRLRPLLLSDSKKLLQLSSRLAVDGTAIGGLFVDDYESRLDHEFWYWTSTPSVSKTWNQRLFSTKVWCGGRDITRTTSSMVSCGRSGLRRCRTVPSRAFSVTCAVFVPQIFVIE
jgi:hypothetical protein